MNEITDAEDALGSDQEVTLVQVNEGDGHSQESENHTNAENDMPPLRRSERIHKMTKEGIENLEQQSLVFSSY